MLKLLNFVALSLLNVMHLVAAQKLLIDAKALELETAAKAELQAVVDGI